MEMNSKLFDDLTASYKVEKQKWVWLTLFACVFVSLDTAVTTRGRNRKLLSHVLDSICSMIISMCHLGHPVNTGDIMIQWECRFLVSVVCTLRYVVYTHLWAGRFNTYLQKNSHIRILYSYSVLPLTTYKRLWFPDFSLSGRVSSQAALLCPKTAPSLWRSADLWTNSRNKCLFPCHNITCKASWKNINKWESIVKTEEAS